MSVSLDDLRAFTFVVEERSVSRGATRLGVTQQAVSERIRRIERQLSIDLFRRRPYGMEPTAAGYRLLPYAQRVVTLVDQALRVVDDDDMLKVAVQGSISWALAFLQDDPGGDRFEVRHEGQAADVLEAVADGKVDVGFGSFPASAGTAPPGLASPSGSRKGGSSEGGATHNPGSADEDGTDDDRRAPAAGGSDGDQHELPGHQLVVETLFDDPVVWVAPPDHPLASGEGSISPTALAELSLGDALGNAAGSNGGGSNGGGVRMASRSSVAGALYEGRLVELQVDLPTWVLPVSIAYRAADADRTSIATLRDAVVGEHQRLKARENRPTA